MTEQTIKTYSDSLSFLVITDSESSDVIPEPIDREALAGTTSVIVALWRDERTAIRFVFDPASPPDPEPGQAALFDDRLEFPSGVLLIADQAMDPLIRFNVEAGTFEVTVSMAESERTVHVTVRAESSSNYAEQLTAR